MASLDSQGEIVATYYNQIWEGKNKLVHFCLHFAASTCLYCRLYLTNTVDHCHRNGLIDVAEKPKMLKCF